MNERRNSKPENCICDDGLFNGTNAAISVRDPLFSNICILNTLYSEKRGLPTRLPLFPNLG